MALLLKKLHLFILETYNNKKKQVGEKLTMILPTRLFSFVLYNEDFSLTIICIKLKIDKI